MIVIYKNKDICGEIAEEFALQHNFKVLGINDNNQILSEVKDDFIILISPQLIDESLLMTCYKVQYKREYKFGIITGLSLDVIKRKLNNYEEQSTINMEDAYFIFRTVNNKINSDLNAEVLTRYDISTSILKEKLTSGKNILSFIMDGSRMHLQTNDGLICGINSDIDKDKIEESYPLCVRNNKIGCCDNMIFASEIKAESILLNSCSSSLIGTSKDGRYINVAMNLLRNSKVIFSGYRPKEGFPSENLLYYLLLKQGYTVGEILYILNLNSYNHCTDYFPYILFGFPNAFSRSESINEINLPGNEVSNNEISIKVPSNMNNYNIINLQLDGNDKLLENIYNRDFDVILDSNLDKDIYYSIIPYKTSKKVKIVVYSWNIIKEDINLRLYCSNKDFRLAELQVRYNNLQKLDSLSFRHKKLQNQVHEYLKNSVLMIQNLKKYRQNFNNKKLTSSINLVRSTEKIISDCLVEDIKKQGNKFFVERYGNSTLLESASHTMHNDAYCPYCGKGLYLKNGRNPILHINRLTAFCSICHNVFDVPIESSYEIKDLNYPRISLVENKGSMVEFKIKIDNMKKIRSINTVYYGIWSEKTSYAEALRISNQREDFELEPSQEKQIYLSVDFKEDIKEKMSHLYSLYVYWLENFEMYVSTYNFNLSNISTVNEK